MCIRDREQTHESLLPYFLEETYEVIESVESNVIVNKKNIRVLASSQNGSVDILPIGEKPPQLTVQSINGDIMQR